MCPQTRPFDEVAKDVYANEGNAQQPTTQHVVPRHATDDGRECALLRHLIRLHQDAAQFYQTAADSRRYPSLNSQLSELKNLHQAIIDSFGLRLRGKSAPTDEYDSDPAPDATAFGDLTYLLTSDNFPVKEVSAAEKITHRKMHHAMEQDDIGADAQVFLAGQIGILSGAEEYLEQIRVLQEL